MKQLHTYLTIMISVLGLIVTINCTNHQNTSQSNTSITEQIKEIENVEIPIDQRIVSAQLLYQNALQTQNDSLLNKSLQYLVKLNYKNHNDSLFLSYANAHLQLSKKFQDTLALAKTLEYKGTFYKNRFENDSALYYYYQSLKNYKGLNDSLQAGKTLLNMAIIQKNTHNYILSEKTSYEALEYLIPKDAERRITSVYNNLGIVYKNLYDYQGAIKFHKKAYELRKELAEKPTLTLHSLNNIGNLYIAKKEYDSALIFLQKGLAYKQLLEKNERVKSYLLDNHTYARFKNGENQNILPSFLEALEIRKEEKDTDGIIQSYLHLAEYYSNDEPLKAIEFLKQAEILSDSVDNNIDNLRSLELLLQKVNPEQAQRLSQKYITAKRKIDSITFQQEKTYDRITFEIDEKENEIIHQRSRKKFWIMGFLILGVILLGTYIYSKKKIQKQKKKLKVKSSFLEKLEYENALKNKQIKQEQQKMLDEQQKVTQLENELASIRELSKEELLDFHNYLAQKYELSELALNILVSITKKSSEIQIANKLNKKVNYIKQIKKKQLYPQLGIKGNINRKSEKTITFYEKELSLYRKNVFKK